jgi:hypothetical protein
MEEDAIDKVRRIDGALDLLNSLVLDRPLSWKDQQAIALVSQLFREQLQKAIRDAEHALALRKKESNARIEVLRMDEFALSWHASENEFAAAMIDAEINKLEATEEVARVFST